MGVEMIRWTLVLEFVVFSVLRSPGGAVQNFYFLSNEELELHEAHVPRANITVK